MELKKTFFAVSAHGEWVGPLAADPDQAQRFRLWANEGGKVSAKMFIQSAWQSVLANLAQEAEALGGAAIQEVTMQYPNIDQTRAMLYFHTDRTEGVSRPYGQSARDPEWRAPVIYRK